MYLLNDLAAGHSIEGPAIIIDQNRYSYYSILLVLSITFFPESNLLHLNCMILVDVTWYSVSAIFTWGTKGIIYDCKLIHSTVLVEPQCTVYITTSGDIRIEVSGSSNLSCLYLV